MSSVYISENCLADTRYEHPFFPLYWSVTMCWLGANPFWLGVPGLVRDGGQEGSLGGTSCCQKGTSSGQGEASTHCPWVPGLHFGGRWMERLQEEWDPSHFPFPHVAIGVVGKPVIRSVNWWQSALKHQIYTEHLDTCCSSHFNLFNSLKQRSFLQCNQDIILRGKDTLGP